MTYEIILEPLAENHLEAHIKAGNKILLKRIYKLLEELTEHPETGAGKPHRLKHAMSGIWSRSIDDRHRMLYTIDNEKVIVFVISLWGHYRDK
jgi:toxin YoeB